MLLYVLTYITKSLQLNFNETNYYIHQNGASSKFGTSMKYCSNQQLLFIGDPEYQEGNGRGAVFIYSWNMFISKFRLFQIIYPNGNKDKRSDNFGQAVTFTGDCQTLFISSYDGIEVFKKTNTQLYFPIDMITNAENLGKTLEFDDEANSIIATDEDSVYQIKVDYNQPIKWFKKFTCLDSVLFSQYTPDRRYYIQCSHDINHTVHIFEFNEKKDLNLQDYETKGEFFRVCQSDNNLAVIYRNNYVFLLKNENRSWIEYSSVKIGFYPAKLYYPFDTLFEAKDNISTYIFYQLVGQKVAKKQTLKLCDGNVRIVNSYFLDTEDLLTSCEGQKSITTLFVSLTPTEMTMKNGVYYAMTIFFILLFLTYFYLFFIDIFAKFFEIVKKRINALFE
ncbi:hypothetical protein M9Y10_034567 [Tritrichomonas musculus]|uniref:Transmembrane protein n=1 Tax=Tritrichomonas musculus TaxID=1915356 RepID=A0ABR2KFU2_9EUKA